MPESESVPLKCTVTLVLFQPLAFAPGEGVALALGAVLSMLMLLTLAGVALDEWTHCSIVSARREAVDIMAELPYLALSSAAWNKPRGVPSTAT